MRLKERAGVCTNVDQLLTHDPESELEEEMRESDLKRGISQHRIEREVSVIIADDRRAVCEAALAADPCVVQNIEATYSINYGHNNQDHDFQRASSYKGLTVVFSTTFTYCD